MDAGNAKESAPVETATIQSSEIVTFHSKRLDMIGILPILESTVEAIVKDAYDDVDDVEYVPNPSLVKDIGERLVVEMDNLARLMNPKTTWQPDWYDEHDDEQTPVSAVLNRSEFAEDYRNSLVETFELPEAVADAILEDMGNLISEQELTISEYYT